MPSCLFAYSCWCASNAGYDHICLVRYPAPRIHLMCAGLWEFPSKKCLLDSPEHLSVFDEVMGCVLGSGHAKSSTCIFDRQRLGDVVHIFSHIHMTMHVELLNLQVTAWARAGALILPTLLLLEQKLGVAILTLSQALCQLMRSSLDGGFLCKG